LLLQVQRQGIPEGRLWGLGFWIGKHIKQERALVGQADWPLALKFRRILGDNLFGQDFAGLVIIQTLRPSSNCAACMALSCHISNLAP
jgi:hypothetical protein